MAWRDGGSEPRFEVGDRALEAFFEGDRRFPVQVAFGEGDVGLALAWVVGGERSVNDLGRASDELEGQLGELAHGEFSGVAEIYGADGFGLGHEPNKSLNEVVDVAEGAGLGAIAVERDILTAESLHDEVGDDAAVVFVHARAVGVEDADDTDIDFVFAVVIEEQGFGASFSFVVTGTSADGVDVAPVGFWLGMDGGIPVYFAGGGLENAGFDSFGEPEAVHGSDD